MSSRKSTRVAQRTSATAVERDPLDFLDNEILPDEAEASAVNSRKGRLSPLRAEIHPYENGTFHLVLAACSICALSVRLLYFEMYLSAFVVLTPFPFLLHVLLDDPQSHAETPSSFLGIPFHLLLPQTASRLSRSGRTITFKLLSYEYMFPLYAGIYFNLVALACFLADRQHVYGMLGLGLGCLWIDYVLVFHDWYLYLMIPERLLFTASSPFRIFVGYVIWANSKRTFYWETAGFVQTALLLLMMGLQSRRVLRINLGLDLHWVPKIIIKYPLVEDDFQMEQPMEPPARRPGGDHEAHMNESRETRAHRSRRADEIRMRAPREMPEHKSKETMPRHHANRPVYFPQVYQTRRFWLQGLKGSFAILCRYTGSMILTIINFQFYLIILASVAKAICLGVGACTIQGHASFASTMQWLRDTYRALWCLNCGVLGSDDEMSIWYMVKFYKGWIVGLTRLVLGKVLSLAADSFAKFGDKLEEAGKVIQ